MASLSGILLGAIQLIAGIFMLATGLGSGIGVKLIVGGALTLISTLLGGPARNGFASSPRYGFDNAQNVTQEGMPIPVVYGRDRFAPPIISVLFDTDGTTEILKYLMLVSEGEIAGISDVRVNGSPASSVGATIETRLGTHDQKVIPGFDRTGAAYAAGIHLGDYLNCTPAPACGEFVFDMKAASDELILKFAWPGGLFHANNDGSTAPTHSAFMVEWKPVGAPDTDYKVFRLPVVNGVRLSGEWHYQYNVDWWAILKESRAPVRAMAHLKFDNDNANGHPGRGRYTIRVRGVTHNTAHEPNNERDFIGWNEVQNAPSSGAGFSYPDCALLAVSIPASASVNGGIPRTDCLVDGRLLYDFRTGETKWSRNPVLIVYDLIVNARYGLGNWLASTDLDIGVGGTFRTMADRCDQYVDVPGRPREPRYETDLVMDTKAESRDWFTQILSGCRMSMLGADGLLKIVEDREKSSVRDFDERLTPEPVAGPPGENAWNILDIAPISLAQQKADVVLVGTRSNILADDETKISSLTVRQDEESHRYSAILIKYIDRDQSFRSRTLTLRDYRLNVTGGTITGGPMLLGEKIQGQTSKVEGWLTNSYATGSRLVTFTVQPGGSTAFVDGETVKGLSSGATFVASGSGYVLVPERRLEVQLFGLTRYSQVMREARYHLATAQFRTLFASWGIGRGDLDLLPGEVVTVYSTRMGWPVGKQFTLLSISYGQNGLGRIEAREYSRAPFAALDRVPLVPFIAPGGAVTPGLRDPADPGAPTQRISWAASPSALSGGSYPTGSSTQIPLIDVVIKK